LDIEDELEYSESDGVLQAAQHCKELMLAKLGSFLFLFFLFLFLFPL